MDVRQIDAAGIESIEPTIRRSYGTMTYQRIGRAEEAEVLLQENDAIADGSPTTSPE